jgi:hypothetical protein
MTAVGHSRRFWYVRDKSGYGVISEMPVGCVLMRSAPFRTILYAFARFLPGLSICDGG